MNNNEENDKDREVDMTTSIVELVLRHNNLNEATSDSQLPILSFQPGRSHDQDQTVIFN